MSRGRHNRLTGIQKVAVLLVGLGPEVSVEIFKQLTEPEIDRLTMEISNVRRLKKSQTEQVLNEFYGMILGQDFMSEGGLDYAREILEKALGKERAMETIGRLTSRLQVKPFNFARKADPKQILNILQHRTFTNHCTRTHLFGSNSIFTNTIQASSRKTNGGRTKDCSNGKYITRSNSSNRENY